MVVDNRVVADDDIGNATIGSDAVIVRTAPVRLQVVNVVVLDKRVGAGQVYAVLDVMDVVAQECPLPADPAHAFGAQSVDLAIFNHNTRRAGCDVDHGPAAVGDLAILQRHIVGIDGHHASNIKALE